MSTLFTLKDCCEYREEVRKSRFLAYAAPVSSADAAMAFFAARADAGATHNCWAYRIGQTYRFNDDGEPGGTAGRPILQAIDGQACDRVAVLVVRWFGGILLGAGGLMRAYGGCAANCLRQGSPVPEVDTVEADFSCTFGEFGLIRARLRDYEALIANEEFIAGGAVISLQVPRHRVVELARMLSDLSRGRETLKVREG